MNITRSLAAGVCLGAAAGLLARSELTRRHMPWRGDRWLQQAVGEVRHVLMPGEYPEFLSVAVRGLDGHVTTWTLRRPDLAPAATFRAGPVPDDVRDLEGA